MVQAPRVAIVGAGFGGLSACKAAVERNMKPTVFEASNTLGGLWKQRNGVVWNGMRSNISFHAMTFSDYPWAGQRSLFPTVFEVGLRGRRSLMRTAWPTVRANCDALLADICVRGSTSSRHLKATGACIRHN